MNPAAAVVTTSPGIWGCHRSSFTSFCPWCTNMSCGGSSGGGSAPRAPASARAAASSSASRSTAKSHTHTESSSPALAMVDASNPAHWSDTTAPLWYEKLATGATPPPLPPLPLPPLPHDRRSQILKDPSSAAVASMAGARDDHATQFASHPACATTRSAGPLRCRTSHTQAAPSQPTDANTPPSTGLHATSSTAAEPWPRNRAAPTAHRPPGAGSHRWMDPVESPDSSRPGAGVDQSSAYPSAACPVNTWRGGARPSLAPPFLEAEASPASEASCGDRSHTCTWPVSEKVATTCGDVGHDRVRVTAPWCASCRTASVGLGLALAPPPPVAAASSSESDSSLSDSSSSSRSARCVRATPVRRATVSVFAPPAASAWLPATRYSACGKRLRPSPSSSRTMSKLRGAASERGSGESSRRCVCGSRRAPQARPL